MFHPGQKITFIYILKKKRKKEEAPNLPTSSLESVATQKVYNPGAPKTNFE
jgi:hypothetical protein